MTTARSSGNRWVAWDLTLLISLLHRGFGEARCLLPHRIFINLYYRVIAMPVTKSELLFLCGGAIAGVAAAKNYSKIKAKIHPFLSGAGEVVGDAYTAAAKKVGERIESMQDSMAEMRQGT